MSTSRPIVSRSVWIATSLAAAVVGMFPLARPNLGAQPASEDKAPQLKEMARHSQSIHVEEFMDGSRPEAAILQPTPIARYNDGPRRIQDATLWLWTRNGHPVAALKVEHMAQNPPTRRWVEGLVSLTPATLSIESPGGWRWTSRGPGFNARRAPEMPAPASSETQRLLQMKALARRFEVEENDGPDRGVVRLRLLPHPIHRYADMASGIQDGAIFSFGVYGTNPDVLLQIEARREGASDVSWFFSFAR